MQRPLIVGLLMKPKKVRKFMDKLTLLEEDKEGGSACRYVAVDMNKPFDKQGEFDALLLKVNHWIIGDIFGDDSKSKSFRSRLDAYLKARRSMAVVGPDAHVRQVLDRHTIHKVTQTVARVPKSLVLKYELSAADKDDADVASARSADDALTRKDMKFPLICKSLIACGAKTQHQMAIVGSKEGLIELVKDGEGGGGVSGDGSLGWIVQEFVPHDGFVYKVYILGESGFVYRRKSLPNVTPESVPTLHWWNSHDAPFRIREGKAVSVAPRLTESGRPIKLLGEDVKEAYRGELIAIARTVAERFQLAVVGVDILMSEQPAGSGRQFGVVDVNYLPSYGEVPGVDFRKAMDRLFVSECKRARSTGGRGVCLPRRCDNDRGQVTDTAKACALV